MWIRDAVSEPPGTEFFDIISKCWKIVKQYCCGDEVGIAWIRATEDHSILPTSLLFWVIHLWCPQENQGFWPLPLWPSTWNMHHSLEAACTMTFQMKYDWNLFKTVLLVIYITNLYWRKISTFYSVQRWNSGTKTNNFFAWEDFSGLRHPHGADHLPPSTRVHPSSVPLPSVWTSKMDGLLSYLWALC